MKRLLLILLVSSIPKASFAQYDPSFLDLKPDTLSKLERRIGINYNYTYTNQSLGINYTYALGKRHFLVAGLRYNTNWSHAMSQNPNSRLYGHLSYLANKAWQRVGLQAGYMYALPHSREFFRPYLHITSFYSVLELYSHYDHPPFYDRWHTLDITAGAGFTSKIYDGLYFNLAGGWGPDLHYKIERPGVVARYPTQKKQLFSSGFTPLLRAGLEWKL